MQTLKRTNKTTPRSECRSVLKNSLTEPTLLEMSGNPTSMISLCQEGKSSPDALRYSILSAFIGEIDAARFAGIMAAKNEQVASAAAATVSASGSHEETPYS
jgi:hypothetical protein